MKKILFSLIILSLFLYSCGDEDVMETPTGYEYFADGLMVTKLNPNGNTPLVVGLEMDFKVSGELSYTVQGEVPYAGTFNFDQNDDLAYIRGLYAGIENTIDLSFTDQSMTFDTTIKVETEPLDEKYADRQVDIDGYNADDFLMCGISYANFGSFHSIPTVIDKNGDIRWYAEYGSNRVIFPVRFNSDGNLLIPFENELRIYNWYGEELNSVSLGNYVQHHESFESRDGNYLVAVDIPSENRVEDFIIKVSPSGSIINTWDMQDILDVDRIDFIDGGIDWFHMNAIYEEEDGSLLISGRNQGVIKVSKDNELEWILAPHKGWGKAGPDGQGFETSDYLLTAINGADEPYSEEVQQGDVAESDFDWPYGQHAMMRNNAGNVLLFDNGVNRHFTGDERYSRAVEYLIDEENMTVKQVWQYGKERGANLQSDIISDVDELGNGNILMTSGFINNGEKAKILEIEPGTNMEVFETTFTFKSINSDGAGWGQADILYRAEKIEF